MRDVERGELDARWCMAECREMCSKVEGGKGRRCGDVGKRVCGTRIEKVREREIVEEREGWAWWHGERN